MEKKKIRQYIDDFSIYDLEGNINTAISILNDIKDKNNFEEIQIEINRPAYSYYEGDSDYFFFYGIRYETDKEFQKRKVEEEREKEIEKKRELETLKNLLEKYSDEII